ncbi:MAG: sigma-54-dependent Fis family transcriptional regulator [Desulfomonile tiedjei]|nr:sigma-54-dependent Fis family transcriptional regulator [Desulfomonile tiedjei]
MRILVIDDEQSILRTFKLRLTQWGHRVLLASDGDSGLEIVHKEPCDVVITDLKMGGVPGEEVVRRISSESSGTEVVVITGFATVESAVEVMKSGATDFLVKPLNFDQVRLVLDKIEKQRSLRDENQQLRDRVNELKLKLAEQNSLQNLVGKSKPMQEVMDLIVSVAPLDCTVTIYGETGTGKEMVARAIHQLSPRSSENMVTVDCGTLTETLLESELFGYEKGAFTGAVRTRRGRFELAHRGTIFLDEVANASPRVQKRLLRIVQEKTFERLGGESSVHTDVRIIAASNRDLAAMVREGSFREDLFYRLNVVPIHMPPLRDRTADLPLLARHFLDLYAREIGREPPNLSPEAIEQIMQYAWPGNVRELAHVMERLVITSSENVIRRILFLEPAEPPPLQNPGVASLDPPLKDQITALEMDYLTSALEACRGRIKEVSQRSGLDERTVRRKMRLYGLHKEDFK